MSFNPTQLTAMDRLAFVGTQGMGALTFSPISEFKPNDQQDIDLATLGLEAQNLFDKTLTDKLDGQTQETLALII